MHASGGKVVITGQGGTIYYGYYCDGRPVELYALNEGDRSLLGNIYLARVDRVAQGISGAFLAMMEGSDGV